MEPNSDANKHDETSRVSDAKGTSRMSLLIRTTLVQKYINVDEETIIKDLRQKVADAFEVSDPGLTVLIFGGKILKDHEYVKTHGIKDGQTIHLVIRNRPTSSDGPGLTSSTSNNQSNRSASANLINNNTSNNPNNNNSNIPNSNNNDTRQEIPTMNPLLGNISDVHQRLQQMLISNPDAIHNMMNPLMQMMSNPGSMRSLFGSMQRMHSLMEQNPEVNHLLSNADVLRESLEMVRNPAALQEVMRTYDRALNNMESMPGGYNVLRRMYTEFQEPLLSAIQENTNQFSSQPNANENANNANRDTGSEIEQQRTENRDPLPNPWAPQPQPTAASQGSRLPFPMNLFGGGGGSGAGPGNLGPNFSSGLERNINSALDGAGPNSDLGAALGGLGGPNLDGISNDSTNDILQRASVLFQDQEFMSFLTHPEALQSIAQIQQGFERLQRIAPNLFERFGSLLLPRTNPGTNTDNNNSNSGATDSSDKTDKDKDKNNKSDDGQDRH